MIPIAAIEDVVRKAGVERISSAALKELQKTIEEIGSALAVDAAQAARHAGRSTIIAEDIKLASGKR